MRKLLLTLLSSTAIICAHNSFADTPVQPVIPTVDPVNPVVIVDDIEATISQDKIRISSVWGRFMEQHKSAAVYMQIENDNDKPITLIDVNVGDLAEGAILHDTTNEADQMKMTKIDSIVIPAHQSVELKPGSLHVMLLGVKDADKFKVDSLVSGIQLIFKETAPKDITITIRN